MATRVLIVGDSRLRGLNTHFMDAIVNKGHPNTKAAVLHGGLNGVYEAVYHAVPTLVIPFGFDAIDNAVRMRDKGMALILSPYDVTAERVHSAMLDLLTNQTYLERARRVSALLKDQPQRPLEKAVFWIEHVMRHAKEVTSHDYLRPAANDLHIWELYLIDVTAMFLSIFSALAFVIYKLMKCMWKGMWKCMSGHVKTKVE